MVKKYLVSSFLSIAVFTGAFVLSDKVLANHSWANYHWAKSENPLTLNIGDNVSSVWDPYLNSAISDWNVSPVLSLSKTIGLSNPRTCKPVLGRIEVCNSKYGNNGWLGIAQIWINGDHITQAVAKMNDTYFNKVAYNTPAWRRLVVCQEIAHGFGLDHQDEIFNNANLGSCMDYTNDPDGGLGGIIATDPTNEHPNTHDFEQLELIYSHLDATLSSTLQTATQDMVKDMINIDTNSPREWGKAIRQNARGLSNVYEKNLGNGRKVITHVLWINDIETE